MDCYDLLDVFKKMASNNSHKSLEEVHESIEVIRNAMSLSEPGSKILIIHIVESAGAIIMGNEIEDLETHQDNALLQLYKGIIEKEGYETIARLGFGNPQKSIPQNVNDFKADILVMGAHGHKALKDIVFGTTVDKVRHRVNIPVFIVKDNRGKL